jgi:hypothetical protein
VQPDPDSSAALTVIHRHSTPCADSTGLNLVLSRGVSAPANELNQIARIIGEHQQELIEAWHDFFDS